MVQSLLVQSLLNRGGLELVTRVGAGLTPDYTLMAEVQAFQAELTGPDQAQVRISMQMTLIRESDRSVAGIRHFENTAKVTSDSTAALIEGLDGVTQLVLGRVVVWVQTLT